MDHIGDKKQNKAVRKSALASERVQLSDLAARQQEESGAFAQQRGLVRHQTREAASMARVSAAEAGVRGASVDALLGDLAFEQSQAIQSIDYNETVTLAQLERAKSGVRADTQNRIAGAPAANPWLTGLKIGSAAVDFGDRMVRRKPSVG